MAECATRAAPAAASERKWTTEARVTRGAGDTSQALPQLLHRAAWVHVCVRLVRIGKFGQVRAWCGERHESAAAAEDHAAALNMGEVKTA